MAYIARHTACAAYFLAIAALSAAAFAAEPDKGQIDVVRPAKAGAGVLPPELTFRARVTAAEPAGKVPFDRIVAL